MFPPWRQPQELSPDIARQYDERNNRSSEPPVGNSNAGPLTRSGRMGSQEPYGRGTYDDGLCRRQRRTSEDMRQHHFS